MSFNKELVTRSIGRTILKTKVNSPHIFFVGGILGIVGSTFLACRATLKLEDIVDDTNKDIQELRNMNAVAKVSPTYVKKQYNKDLFYISTKGMGKVARLYAPAIVVGGASIAALTGSHIQLTRRNGALTATLAAVSKAYDEYRSRVRGEIGEKRELELYHDIRDGELEINGKKQLAKIVNPDGLSPYARFFDEHNVNWQNNMEMNRIFIQCQQNYANHLLTARGHVFLNEVYDSLGLERSRAGAVVGWVRKGDGDGFIDFGLYEHMVNIDWVLDDGPSLGALLDFNVDGVVYDKI